MHTFFIVSETRSISNSNKTKFKLQAGQILLLQTFPIPASKPTAPQTPHFFLISCPPNPAHDPSLHSPFPQNQPNHQKSRHCCCLHLSTKDFPPPTISVSQKLFHCKVTSSITLPAVYSRCRASKLPRSCSSLARS